MNFLIGLLIGLPLGIFVYELAKVAINKIRELSSK
jgi:hypothetical protein